MTDLAVLREVAMCERTFAFESMCDYCAGRKKRRKPHVRRAHRERGTGLYVHLDGRQRLVCRASKLRKALEQLRGRAAFELIGTQ